MATYWENSCSFGLRYVSWYKYLIVSLVFSHLGFWSGNLFLIAPFSDLCLIVPFFEKPGHNIHNTKVAMKCTHLRSTLVCSKGWLPCLERASHSALCVCCRKNVLLCFTYFLSHLVSMLRL